MDKKATCSRLVILLGVVLAGALAAPVIRSDPLACSATFDGDTVDLSPLKRTDANWPLTVVDTNTSQHYTYYLGICAPLINSSAVAGCLSQDPSAQGCQTLLTTDPPNPSFPKLLGVGGTIRPLSGSTSFSDGFEYFMTGGAGNSNSCHKTYQRSVSILFSCGPSLGTPEFYTEENCTYIIKWQSSAACVPTPTPPHTTHAPGTNQPTQPTQPTYPPSQQLPCTAVDATGQTYDLSPLAGVAWMATDIRQNANYTDYISVCGSLPSPPPASCPPGYAACQTSVGPYVPRPMGLPASPVFKNGVLTLIYPNGKPCSTGANRTTYISFACSKTAGLGHPVFNREDNCTYYFDWTTAAACPPTAEVGNACSATDPVTGDVYDLTSLTGTWNTNGFNVAVCRTAQGCKSTGVCKGSQSYGAVSAQLEVMGSSVALFYRNGSPCPQQPSRNLSASIMFVCDTLAQDQANISLTLITSGDSCSPIFEMRTALVCPQHQIECVATDPARHATYDLSVLALASPQWVVLGNGYTFLLGLCGPAGDASPCPPGVAACQLKASDSNFSKSLGYATTSPTVIANGTLLVTYTGGEACHGGADVRSTILMLRCNPAAGVGAPMYVAEHANCSYEFLWETSQACPVSTIVGDQCSYQDPVSGINVDLSPLKGKDASVVQGLTTYYVSVCGLIKNQLCSHEAACSIYNDDSKISYGQPSTAVTVADQTVSLTYTSQDSCKPGVAYSARIIFACDPNSPPSAAPRVELVPGADACSVTFRWYTSLVCTAALPAADCTLLHDGLVYDLSPLALASSNYFAFTTATSTTDAFMYELNVCRQLVRTGAATACPPGAAACQIPLGNTTHSAKSLGLPASPVWDPQAGLTLVYANGTGLCHGTHQRSTFIHFVCPADGVDLSPSFLGESAADCSYTFQWVTTAACPVKQIVGSNCKLTEPTTNQVIDLTPLKKLGPQIVSDSTGLYSLQVCQALTNNCPSSNATTGAQAGGCQRASNNKTFTTGVANDALMFYDGVVTLQYTGGDACHSGAYHRSTTIHFECDLAAGLGRPEFVTELTTCDYIFRWRTALTCSTQVPCRAASADGRQVFDLTPLSRADRNWRASDTRQGGKFAYELNVCRSVVARPGWQCNPFGGACQIVNASADFTLGYIGRPAVVPSVAGPPLLVIDYTGGDACHGGKFSRSARIEFTCPLDPKGAPLPGILGEPEFLYEGPNCTYVFSWRTSAACPLGSFPPVVGSSCTVAGPTLDRSYSLSPLAGRVVNVTYADYTYQLSVCGPLSGPAVPVGCSGAGACQLKAGQAPVVTGQPSAAVAVVNGAVVLNMTGGKPCHNGAYTRTTLITFLCGPDAVGTPQFVAESSTCEYSFVWYTAAACGVARQTECVVVDPDLGISYDLSGLARTSTNWLVFRDNDDNSFDVFELNVCHALVGSVDTACQGATAACLERDNTSIAIGNVARPQIYGGIPYLQYTGGPCPHTPGANYTTYIMFTCNEDGYLGSPDIMDDDDDECTYSFVWDTVYGCGPASPTLAPTTAAAPTTKTPAPYTGTGTTTTATTAVTTTTMFVPLSGSECVTLGPNGLVDLTALSFYNFTAECSDDDDMATSDCEQYTYMLTVCGYMDCFGTLASACQIPNGNGDFKPMGYYTAPPSFVGSQLTLEYTHGSLCHKQYERRTRINFMCDMSAGNGVPVFDSETADCVYIFSWRTARACVPTALPSLDCLIDGPNYAYDLHVLGRRPGQQDWVVRGTKANETMTINVCRHLQTWPTSACEGAAACLTTAAKPGQNEGAVLNLGYAMAEPGLSVDGTLVMEYSLPQTYSLQQCQYGGTRSVVITFSCREGTIGEPVLVDQIDDCVYYINWQTYAACNLKVTSTPSAGSLGNCSLQDPATGNHYDLSVLGSATRVIDTTEYSFHLAVCGAAAGCDGKAGACQISPKATLSTGLVSKDLRLASSGALVLQYRGGSLCHRNTSSQMPRSTFIQFVCDRAAVNTVPIFSGESDCTYFFTWTTQAACAQTRDVECLVTDPATGHQYDLTPLKLFRGNWPIEPANATKYLFEMNVCRSLNPTSDAYHACALASGICQVETSNTNVTYSLGQPAKPTWSNGQLSIVYTLGDQCKTGPRTTTVQFVCPAGNVNTSFPLGRPKFVGEPSTCNYMLRWESTAACPLPPPETTTSCTVPVADPVTGEIYNIGALNKIYKTTDSSGQTYLINPCSALGSNCSDNSQARACQLAADSHVYSIGATSQWTFADGVVSLAITGGKPCHNGQATRSALITFSCNREQDLGPLFVQETGDCTYQFTWPSPLACPYTPILECGAHLPSGAFVDLSGLSVGNGATSVAGAAGTFYLNVCSRAQHAGCAAEAGACLVQPDGTAVSLGQYRGTGPAWTGSSIALGYAGGDRCPTGGRYSSTIKFQCGPENLVVSPATSNPCAFVFTWTTCQACNGAPCVASTASPASHGVVSDEGSSNTAGIAAGILVTGVVVAAVLVLFYRRPDLWQKVRDRAVALVPHRSSSTPGFKYSKVGVEAPQGGDGSSTSLFGTGDDDAEDDELMPM